MSDALKLEAFKQFSDVVMIALVKLEVDAGDPIHLCNNSVDIMSNGIMYEAYGFSFVPPSDSESQNSASITIDNTDQLIMSTIQGSETISVTVSVVSTLDLDRAEYGPVQFKLQNVTMNTGPGTITGNLVVDDYLSDVVPRYQYSSKYYRGLF